MQQQVSLKLLPCEAAVHNVVQTYIANALGLKSTAVTGFHILKHSMDARARQVYINLTLLAFINEPFFARQHQIIQFHQLPLAAKRVVIVGAGPAGLFAALQLIEKGIKPIVLERGKDIRSRRRDLATLNKVGIINPESNYCFGEGGAGTYSDGKLYTRSNKRGNINRILNLFVQFGANNNILVEAHPHIGTNKLPNIIAAMRQAITDNGGEFYFNKKVTALLISNSKINGVTTADGDHFAAGAVILATGHSARDVFFMLHQQAIKIEAKPFALGVRVEHPQLLIDEIQYGNHRSDCTNNGRGEFLPPASYSLVQQVNNKGVFSFCMCPGGIIATASTNPGELVVNGWSPSKRNNPFANSGMVVTCELADVATVPGFTQYLQKHNSSLASPFALLYFQQMVEEAAYAAGGGNFVAPAQRMTDFCTNKQSASLPPCSYLPGVIESDLQTVLPSFIYKRLRAGFASFGQKMRGYYTSEAMVVATESRTSAPVRIPRHAETLQHPQVANLYPCGEGAGYAGGIVSAAMDGERVANAIASQLANVN